MSVSVLGLLLAPATVVDWEALADTALASLVGGIVVALSASTAIWGAATFADAQREERYGAAGLAAAVAVIGGVVFAGAIVAGLLVMING